MKYIKMNLRKYLQVPFTENFKKLLKKIKRLNKWRDISLKDWILKKKSSLSNCDQL